MSPDPVVSLSVGDLYLLGLALVALATVPIMAFVLLRLRAERVGRHAAAATPPSRTTADLVHEAYARIHVPGEDTLVGRACKNCKHFDLEEGQATLKQSRVFMQAASNIPPSMMGREVDHYETRNCGHCYGSGVEPTIGDTAGKPERVCHLCHGEKTFEEPVFKDTKIPNKAKWEEFGACQLHSEVRWGGDVCESFELTQLRVKP